MCQFQFLKTPCEIEPEKDKQCVAYALAHSNVCVSSCPAGPLSIYLPLCLAREPRSQQSLCSHSHAHFMQTSLKSSERRNYDESVRCSFTNMTTSQS